MPLTAGRGPSTNLRASGLALLTEDVRGPMGAADETGPSCRRSRLLPTWRRATRPAVLHSPCSPASAWSSSTRRTSSSRPPTPRLTSTPTISSTAAARSITSCRCSWPGSVPSTTMVTSTSSVGRSGSTCTAGPPSTPATQLRRRRVMRPYSVDAVPVDRVAGPLRPMIDFVCRARCLCETRARLRLTRRLRDRACEQH
jgi:hypothetical protein